MQILYLRCKFYAKNNKDEKDKKTNANFNSKCGKSEQKLPFTLKMETTQELS